MVNKYFKSISEELKVAEKPQHACIKFLLNYSKSLEYKKGKKHAVLLIKN
jgi:hypothetical protein